MLLHSGHVHTLMILVLLWSLYIFAVHFLFILFSFSYLKTSKLNFKKILSYFVIFGFHEHTLQHIYFQITLSNKIISQSNTTFTFSTFSFTVSSNLNLCRLKDSFSFEELSIIYLNLQIFLITWNPNKFVSLN